MSNNEENFNENLKNVITFDTVEDFWSIYSHIVRPDKMPENG
jgi:translation initiation factor 4E